MVKNFFLNLSLNKKLVLMMLVMTAVLLVTLITIYWQSEKNLMAQIESQTAELAQAVQVASRKYGGASSETRLEKYLSSLKTKGIKEISIISNADEIIASTNPNKIGTPVSQKKKELIIKAELGEPAVDQEGKAYNVILPVIAGQAHYGYIHLQINVENLQETMRRNTTKRIIAALTVFAIGILLSTFLSMWYTEPIHNVVAAARRGAAGDLNQNLPGDRKDEIGT
jgi:sensor histidine kinase regulating citrate/malate metabolism